MRMNTIVLFLSLLLSLETSALLAAQEQPGEHAKHDTRTITLDGNDVRPSQTNMDHGELLAFANFSSHPVRVTFTEPVQLKDKIRCGLIHGGQKHVPSPAWALFSWQDDKLIATVPPGQFASVCSLEPGSYAFTATRISSAAPGSVPGQELPAKGQIVVK